MGRDDARLARDATLDAHLEHDPEKRQGKRPDDPVGDLALKPPARPGVLTLRRHG
jgi:hypothetical protein